MAVRNLFIDRQNGTLARVSATDKSYAYLDFLSPVVSKYAMPRVEYEASFVERFRPVTEKDLATMLTGDFELPLNAPESWK